MLKIFNLAARADIDNDGRDEHLVPVLLGSGAGTSPDNPAAWVEVSSEGGSSRSAGRVFSRFPGVRLSQGGILGFHRAPEAPRPRRRLLL